MVSQMNILETKIIFYDIGKTESDSDDMRKHLHFRD